MNTSLTTCTILALALLASGASAQEPAKAIDANKTGMTKQDKPLTISKSARSALKEAKGVAAKAKGLKGAARAAAMTAAAKAYEAVASRFADQPGARAAASFEAAELWRRAGSLKAAAANYTRATDNDPRRFRERSWLQLAHIERRQKRIDKAMALYQKMARLKSGTSRTHEARVWIGRCLEQRKKLADAADAYRQALSLTRNPRRVIDLCNRLSLVLVRQGKLDQGAAVIRQAETAVAKAGCGSGGKGKKKGKSQAKSLRRALDKMSARKALQRARDKANGAHRDAQDLERGRK